MWAIENDCGEIIREAWSEWPSYTTLKKIDHTKEKLTFWHNLSFRKMRRKIDHLSNLVRQSGSDRPTDQTLGEESSLKEELNILLEREETYWKQRSRIQWLKEGDKNTAFFHK